LALAFLGAEAGIPPGVFNVVTGDPEALGDVLTTDQRVRKFSFTGSTAVGKVLAARCMGTVKRVSLELGGNAPFIVFDDADLDRAVDGAMASKFRNAGQTCVCANRILVQAGIHDEFAARLSDRVRKLVVGNGLERDSQVGPLINERAREKVRSHVRDAVDLGARVLTCEQDRSGRGYFFQPTVLTGITDEMRMFHEETFGPVAGLTRFDRDSEAIELANKTSAGLAAYVYTRDASRTWRMGEALDYGMVGINTGMISTEVAPFGGIKESGLGREGSHYGLDEYLDIKMLCSEVAPA
jgi:succinate-semialdehyde dehydrogenase/glutarate-semialdehyde dehydrogenase